MPLESINHKHIKYTTYNEFFDFLQENGDKYTDVEFWSIGFDSNVPDYKD